MLALLFKNDGIIGGSNIYLLEWSEVVHPFPDFIIDASSKKYVCTAFGTFSPDVNDCYVC